MKNELFTDAERIKYILDTCCPWNPLNGTDEDRTKEAELRKVLLKNRSNLALYEMTIESIELGFDSLAVLDWMTPGKFSSVVKMAVDKYDLKTIYFGSRASDFINDLEMFLNLGFHIDKVVNYQTKWRERKKALKLIR